VTVISELIGFNIEQAAVSKERINYLCHFSANNLENPEYGDKGKTSKVINPSLTKGSNSSKYFASSGLSHSRMITALD